MDVSPQNAAREATTCVVALNFIRERFGEAGGMNSEQRAALEKAITLYRSRAGANAMPANQFAEKLKKAESAMPDVSDHARASLRCLQGLAPSPKGQNR